MLNKCILIMKLLFYYNFIFIYRHKILGRMWMCQSTVLRTYGLLKLYDTFLWFTADIFFPTELILCINPSSSCLKCWPTLIVMCCFVVIDVLIFCVFEVLIDSLRLRMSGKFAFFWSACFSFSASFRTTWKSISTDVSSACALFPSCKDWS